MMDLQISQPECLLNLCIILQKIKIYGLVGLAKTKTSGSYPKVNSESLALGVG